eukprot:6149149-Prymnesium_polylepis.1
MLQGFAEGCIRRAKGAPRAHLVHPQRDSPAWCAPARSAPRRVELRSCPSTMVTAGCLRLASTRCIRRTRTPQSARMEDGAVRRSVWVRPGVNC